MTRWYYIPILTLLLTTAYAQNTLISFGSIWHYSDLGQEPAIQSGTEWFETQYDQATWPSGNAQLGYGDGDEATEINNSVITGYFRHEFQVADPSSFESLSLDLLFDDGAVVYLNGNEIWRVNMPTGDITYGTFAASSSSDDDTESTVMGNVLSTGLNVLAVEVHQRSSSSSDISFDFKLVANPAGSVNIIRGPYLQKGSPNSMTIKWRTSAPTESVIHYGTTSGNLNQTISDGSNKIDHEIQIQNLPANTKYYYAVANDENTLLAESSDLYFKTSPSTGSQQSITAWVLGDCGTGNSNARAVRDAFFNYIGQSHLDMILFLGDNAYSDGTDSEYQTAIFENMYEERLKNTVSWSCLGNHDGHSANSGTQDGPYYDIFSFPTQGESGGTPSGTEAYYSFNYGPIHFISLDSYDSDRSVGGSMYTWCEADLQNTTAEWIVAFWHHPAYSKGSHDSDSESKLEDMRQNFVPLLENYGVDLVLSGHSHSYERSYFINGHYGTSNTFSTASHTVGPNGSGDGRTNGDGAYQKSGSQTEGAVYITSGSSGKTSSGSLDHEAMFYSVSALGSCILEVAGGTMNVKFLRETGAVDDYFSIVKDVSCQVGTSCNDGDPCTTNDMYDANCDCNGTFADSDGDGVCDFSDQCPGFDDNLIGTTCDDQNECTTDDVYNNQCQCVGTLLDSDGDGVCDMDDICPGYDDMIDSDGDGIPDGCDDCNEAHSFPENPLHHTGTGLSSTTLDFQGLQTDVSFTIQDLSHRQTRKRDYRYIDEVTVSYTDDSGVQHVVGTYYGDEQEQVNVQIGDAVQSVSVSLTDAYDGNSSVDQLISFSQINSCAVSAAANLSQLLGFTAKVDEIQLNLRPNPVSDLLQVDLDFPYAEGSDYELAIVDYRGARIWNQSFRGDQERNTHDVDVEALTPGIYVLLLTSNGEIITRNFVVAR